jgi:hypothetical protein
MLYTGDVDDELDGIDITASQPNPEQHKFTEWRWFSVFDSDKDLPSKMTWLTVQALEKVLEIKIDEAKCAPCPFKKTKLVS